MPGDKESRSFWITLPGILTGIAALLTAVAGLILAFKPNPPVPQPPYSPPVKPYVSPAVGDIDPGVVKPNNTAAKDVTVIQPPNPKLVLTKTSFFFPGDGTKNENGGETATIQTNAGAPIGNIYFFDFEDAINISNTKSAAAIIKVLVSGAADLTAPGSPQIQERIVFVAGNSSKGERKSVVAGNLRFIAVLEKAQIVQSAGNRFDMGSVAIKVDVELLDH